MSVAAVKVTGGDYIVNGPGSRSQSGRHEGAGAVFTYTEGDGTRVEMLEAEGPLATPVDLQVRIYHTLASTRVVEDRNICSW